MPIATLRLNTDLKEITAEIVRKSKEAWSLRRLNISKAKQLAEEAFQESRRIDYKEGIAFGYRNLGVIHFLQNHFHLALPDLQNARTLFLELGNHKGVSSCYRNIGNIYTQVGALDKASFNYELAVEHADKSKDIKSIAFVKGNLGLIKQLSGDYQGALKLLFECLQILDVFDDIPARSETIFNIGNNFLQLGDLESAEKNLRKALQLADEVDYLKGVSQAYTVLGVLYFKLNMIDKSLRYLHLGLASSLELNERRISSETYKQLAAVYKSVGNYEKAVECLERYDEIKAKLAALDSKTLMESLQVEIDFEKSEKESLESKNKELEFAYQIIKDKNKDITDSIKYAKHIQHALLPEEGYISEYIPRHFILYMPKEIVSGDFYWFQAKDGLSYFAVVDCTGHGVPGAFISIVGQNCLNGALREKTYTNAAEMLDRVMELFNQNIQQKYEESTVKDGMDLSLCIFDFKNRKLSFAGANHNLHLIRDGELIEYKGNKHSIGIFIGDEIKPYTEVQIKVEDDDIFYLFSDGYADQFGGPDYNQKYMRKRLKNFLKSISHYPLARQKELIRNDFLQWKGPLEQIDDILIAAIKI